jgi:phosphohistidine phosphatase
MQTAQILARTLDPKKDRVVADDNLSPVGDWDRLVPDISEKFADYDHIALVGHEPSLGDLISVLLSGNPTLAVSLKKGGVCKLSLDELEYSQCATLEWLLSPAQLVEIAA